MLTSEIDFIRTLDFENTIALIIIIKSKFTNIGFLLDVLLSEQKKRLLEISTLDELPNSWMLIEENIFQSSISSWSIKLVLNHCKKSKQMPASYLSQEVNRVSPANGFHNPGNVVEKSSLLNIFMSLWVEKTSPISDR